LRRGRALPLLFALLTLFGSLVAGSHASTTSASAAKAGAKHFTVSVSGDLLMHQPLLDRARANAGGSGYDFAPFFKAIAPYVADVDLGLCHVETPMGPGPITTYPIFNTPTDLAKSIHRSGWDACDSASNHSLDGGQAGIDGTVKALHKAGVEHTGSFSSEKASNKPTIIDVDGIKIGYVAYTDATNGFTPPHPWSLNTYPAANPKAGAKAIIHDARKARDAGADAVIAQIHWGTENAQHPNASQMAVAKQLTGAKVISVVVGQGPHVVQPIKRINGKFVVFSEGNLVSNQSASAGLPTETEDGLIGLLHFKAVGEKVTVRRVTYVPTWVHLGDYIVEPAKPSGSSTLRESYNRTVHVVGKGKGFGPAF
jgi:poly-gamma-glutamate capsule biosynthesis protein CapA/YwtB (metallophosphatase superfamily)